MKQLKQRTQGHRDERGQGFVEYAIILILVGIAVVLVVSLMQPAIGEVFSRFVAQAPVAPPSLLDYTPPPTWTSSPTLDPNAPSPTNTAVPSNTPVPPVPTNTVAPSNTPTPTNTTAPTNTPVCGYGPYTVTSAGTVRVQMENFRCGGAGVSFSDQTGDGGPGSGAYRSDYGTEGPDLQTTSDAGGGYNLGWTRDGEWLEYEIISPANFTFTFVFRTAAPNGNNPRIQIRTTMGGLVANTNTLNVGTTGDWQTWQNYATNVTLFEGTNIVRINIVGGGGNYNYFEIQPYVPTATPTPVTPTATPIPTNTPSPTPAATPVVVTLYSNAAHDGDVQELNNQAVGNQIDNGGNSIGVGDNNDNDNEQFIGIVSFDTSVIPANATILSVQLRLQQRNGLLGNPFGDNGLGFLYADIGPLNGFSGNYALQSSDFQALAAANNVITLSETSGNNQWSTGTMGAGNFGLINRNGFTQFKIHFQFPDDNDRTNDRFRFDSGNTNSEPELIISYTIP